ncbi:MAG: ISL3 family transposase [Acidobacteriota bacterium]
MNKNIISLLKVPGFHVTDVVIEGEEIMVSVRKRSKTARCSKCLKRSSKLKDYRPYSKILHMMLCNQKVYLSFRKRRFVCLNCSRIFTEQISFIPRYSRQSIFVRHHALERLSDSSFHKTKERIGISYGGMVSLLRKVFTLETINWQEQIVKGVLRIGIDEHHLGKRHKYLVTIANLLTGKPIHILPDDKQKTLRAFLKQLPEDVKEIVDEVAIDMRKSFITAVAKELPNTRIVIDHFHLIQDANRRVQEARKIEEDVQEKINDNGPRTIKWKLLTRNKEDLKGDQDKLIRYYLHKYPAIGIFYSCKEKLRDMYKAKDKQDAERQLIELIRFMYKSEYAELGLWAKSLTTYQPYILNYFDNHTTNAVTEGLHRKFKLIQRQAYGFRNPEVYARRIMLACLPLPFIYPHI